MFEIDQVARSGLDSIALARLSELCQLFGDELLDGLELDDSPEFNAWLNAQRHRYRGLHLSLLEAFVRRAPLGSDESFVRLKTWLSFAPFDVRAHAALFGALVARGQLRDADEHAAKTIRAFEHEGIDWSPLREALQVARAKTATPTRVAIVDNSPIALPQRRRASVAIMPLVDTTSTELERGRIGDWVTEDIITGLAKLRACVLDCGREQQSYRRHDRR